MSRYLGLDQLLFNAPGDGPFENAPLLSGCVRAQGYLSCTVTDRSG